MGDSVWPPTIKPLTSKTYATSRGSNVLNTPVSGGLPRIALDATLESPPFTLNFILSDLGYQAILNYYDVTLNHGANSFKMQLDSGQGIEEHLVNITPGTWKASRPSHGTWYLAFNAIAETTSSIYT